MARAGKVSREVSLEREKQSWALRQRGFTHRRIADELNVDHSTVTRILQRVSKRAIAHLTEVVQEQIVAQLAQLEYITDETFQAWHRSKEPEKSVAKRTMPGARNKFGQQASNEEITIQTQDQDGNVRYLTEARAALTDIRKLLNIEIQKFEFAGPGGGPIQTKDVTELTDDERADRIAAILDKARERRDRQAPGSE